MGAFHIAQQGGAYEPQRKFDFELHLMGVPGQDVITLAVKAFTLPEPTNTAIEVGYLNSVVKVAGQGKWGDGQITVRDFVDIPVAASLMAWKALVHDPANDNIGFAKTYKKQGELHLLSPDGETVRRYKMIGIWPNSVKLGAMDYSGNDATEIEVALSCDKSFMLPG